MSGLILNVLNQVDTLTGSFVMNGYQGLVSSYAPAIYGLVGLGVVIFGYAIVQGTITLSYAELSKRLLTIGMVLMLAMHWGTFSTYVYDLLVNAPNQIVGHLLQALPGASFSDQGSANAALEQAYEQGVGFASAAWQQGSALNVMPRILAVLIFAAVIVLIGLALVELIVAKFGLATFLVLAPLIIPCYQFQPTRAAVFDGWLKQLVTFAFIPIFLYSAIALGFTLTASTVIAMQNAVSSQDVNLTPLVSYFIGVVVCVGLVLKATSMAASLAGGFASGAASQNAWDRGKQAASWAGSKAKQAGKWAYRRWRR